ncbi:UDP-N-acetylmuramoyl-tripeptide--D-alanyl-D-alanine ligase [Fulvivirga lutea]|uniref:UDP-N-acetylmuramoyl-tripeptide--D-alanyl-D-alanine ligase n=1 Tax=Fulvivirga lutea TaxID=2810512 RepID=A0A975A1W8_9BACT|nr:UDP-N-acetylmuramoyl-tripeptide--D-alanyl-D-alanine ligase [Fulvivirga lutea]QSE97932.1 UDP-N-acetylmuramoyl-tripeptide--D-alanyl-D-alanine ligase [Fulvivirga lutea]
MIESLYQHYLRNPKISTDTRKIEEGSLFFALKGPNFDANKFADEALNKGAALCIVDDKSVVKDDRYFLVDDALVALQDLARHHRKQLTIPIIGLTGSNGKTTSKELLACVLRQKFNVFATKGNLNNHIGVALSMLSINSNHEIAVIEMGANFVGDIAFLCTISSPTHGYITNIGKAHLEGFGGIEGVIRGKSELYHHLIKHDGVVWINSTNEILSNMAKRFKNPLFYPKKGDYYHCEFISADPNVLFKAENGEEVQTNLIGSYNFENIATALCIGKYFDVPATDANKAIADYIPENNRSQVIKKGSNTIILDAYNANPTSMAKALENLNLINAENKVAILGDMKELGEDSEKEHKAIGDLLNEYQIKKVYLCGELIKATQQQADHAKHYQSVQELIDELKANPITNSTVLIKASRSIGLERVLEAF